MKLQEYQAKDLLRQAGLAVPDGEVAASVDEAVRAAEALGYPVAIKAQVLAGGRGKAGGIRLARDREEAKRAARDILGMTLNTAQTGAKGERVDRVLVEAGQRIKQELYLSILPDRATATITIMASRDGGMDIEEVAARDPNRIIRIQVQPLIGLLPFHQRRLAFALGLAGELARPFFALLERLYRLVIDRDLLLAEINPLVITGEGKLVLLDAKMEVDDSALFRQQELATLRDRAREDPLEAQAREAGLNYIRLQGNIGTMVNGAGLAMATMDLIKQAGGEPANFLDVGGGANADMIEQGFRILMTDPDVRAILINIFGGILRCDVLATGVVEAAAKAELNLPVVVRMEGTNAEQGRKILADSGLQLISARDLSDAARSISRLAGAA